ncbi:MAG: DUF3072 domain-containing protein [Gemmatimonadaceae bacterium]
MAEGKMATDRTDRTGQADGGPEGLENTIKDPSEWKTGDEPMTGAQRSYLETLSTAANEPAPDDTLTKAEASKRIDELREITGRGESPPARRD